MEHDEEEQGDEEHEERVKDEEGSLIVERVPVLAQKVLDHAEDGPDHDEQADRVEHVQDLEPWDARGGGASRGRRGAAAVGARDGEHAGVAHVKRDGDDDKEAEHDDLHEQADQQDILAQVLLALHGHLAAAAGLQEEGEDVAKDKGLCQPRRADEAARGALGDAHDEAAQDHVDRGGEEGRRDEDEDGLYYKGEELVGLVVGYCEAYVSDCLDCFGWG